ncbi:AAA family ATPase [Actinocorallia sp. B10E7]|uniref:AAA family ATPase n=1 Tax=Actinocorallia sp. B10E7 TaxID=3153558 RepID=UPI00325F7125
MIIWLNGPFGAGKTTTAELLTRRIPGGLLYDPEEVGALVRRLLPDRTCDFQDVEIWRPLVADAAHRLLQAYGGTLVVPMTLLDERYATEVFGLLDGYGVTVHHITLTCDPGVLRERIDQHVHFPDDPILSEDVRQWRLSKIGAYVDAMSWLPDRSHLVDTTSRPPQDVADQVLKAVG